MVIAKNKGVDCFYSIDIMESRQYLDELKFEADLGNLHYYMYNWKCADIDTHELGLVLP
jgi:glycylpeptide N-tetradecanoyltransferase